MVSWFRGVAKNRPLVAFFVLAYAITWLSSLIFSFSVQVAPRVLPAVFAAPGFIGWYYGPALAAILVTAAVAGRTGIRQLLRRFLDWRVRWGWYAFIILYPLALHLVVVGIVWLVGGPAPRFFESTGVPKANPLLTLIGLVVYQIVVRGVGEETGWRGFALPRMQGRWGPLYGSLLLGLLWGLWHFHPANWGVLLSWTGVFIFLNIVASTVVYTWVYNGTGGSLLMAALFHMTANVSEWIVPIGAFEAMTTSLLIQNVVLWVIVVGLVLVAGPRLGLPAQAPATVEGAVARAGMGPSI